MAKARPARDWGPSGPTPEVVNLGISEKRILHFSSHVGLRMRPILLKGHDGPLTCVKYNKDGDLLFTTCKRGRICLWYSDDGERIGTYNKHNGAVMYVDVNCKCHCTSK